MNQVKESKIIKFIEGLKNIVRELSVNDEISDSILESEELTEVRSAENTNKIEMLKDEVLKVYISLDDSELDDSDKIAPKAKVSEKLAIERLEQIETKKVIEKDEQSQIG